MARFFSICIPTWEAGGNGAEYLEHSLNILAYQTFKDFEVVISDNSLDDKIEILCNEWSKHLNIRYFRNLEGRGSISVNLNYALKQCKGKWIKILFQDDFLLNEHVLQKLYDATKDTDKKWLLNGTAHTPDMIRVERSMKPVYHDNIHYGHNTISCPTVLTIKNENILLFDENLVWLVDVEYYKRCHDAFGSPLIINEVCTIIREHPEQVTHTITSGQSIKDKEYEYIVNKYGEMNENI